MKANNYRSNGCFVVGLLNVIIGNFDIIDLERILSKGWVKFHDFQGQMETDLSIKSLSSSSVAWYVDEETRIRDESHYLIFLGGDTKGLFKIWLHYGG